MLRCKQFKALPTKNIFCPKSFVIFALLLAVCIAVYSNYYSLKRSDPKEFINSVKRLVEGINPVFDQIGVVKRIF